MILTMYNTLFLSMIYTGFKRVGTWWNYKNVISPFYRLYYVEKGKGKVYINNLLYELAPGTLFLIPKFTFHSYECDDFMDHYYICFFDDVAGSVGIPNPMQMNFKIVAQTMDINLIKRYLDINPSKSLVVSDPRYYDNDKTMYEFHEQSSSYMAQSIESNGILLQLFSRFVTVNSVKPPTTNSSYEKLDVVVQYINKHLTKRIAVPELAQLIHLTPDHFSKVFKKVMGTSPCEFIQMKRIERAQALLLTSRMSIMQIAESVGIYNPAQFTRLFTKISQCPPKEYRAKQLNI
ncbi:AraC family transcriptional regulator [Bacteroides salyersiae]|uniref:AraC family transcriptional regulator n=1 Tax=Bacteroides salyersiae TaxID=291644 RepID=UPI00189BCCF7|nr:AraC family transcriptional regulator [Bacteroides salyersiae]